MFIEFLISKGTTLNTKSMALLITVGLLSGFSASLYAQQATDEKGWYRTCYGVWAQDMISPVP